MIGYTSFRHFEPMYDGKHRVLVGSAPSVAPFFFVACGDDGRDRSGLSSQGEKTSPNQGGIRFSALFVPSRPQDASHFPLFYKKTHNFSPGIEVAATPTRPADDRKINGQV